MNAVSLNNLWAYLQGLTLTASNKKWLADHLNESAMTDHLQNEEVSGYPRKREDILAEAAKKRLEKEKELWSEVHGKKSNFGFSQEMLDIVSNVKPMPADIDIEKIKYDYIMKKYG